MRIDRVCVIALVAFLNLSTALCALEPGLAPPGDECLTNRFGWSWSEPIPSGWLIVAGKYIDAPYIVEQRGYRVYVNGVKIEDGVTKRSVLPPVPPPPLAKDPGFPTNLTMNSRLTQVVLPPVYDLKCRYWDYLGLSGDARIKAEMDYLLKLPNVARVEDTGVPVYPGDAGRCLVLYGHDGTSMKMNAMTGPRPQPSPPNDPGLLPIVQEQAERLEKILKRGEFVFSNGSAISTYGYAYIPIENWKKIFTVFAENSSPEKKCENLRGLGLFDSNEKLSMLQSFFPFTNFQPTTQLWQRVNGDVFWTNDAPAMLQRLTNGWVQIPPKWEREPVAIAASTPNVVARPVAPAHIPATNAVPKPLLEPEPLPSAEPPASQPVSLPSLSPLRLLSLGGAILAVAILLLTLRRKG